MEPKSVPNAPEKALSTAEAAELLGVSTRTLAKWRCKTTRKPLPFVKIGRQVVTYLPSDIAAFQRSRRRS